MSTEICVLNDGRRVKYRLDLRKTSKFYYVYFKGPDGLRREISTKEINQKCARDSAVAIIRLEFEPGKYYEFVSWDKAIELMVEQMKGKNLRPNTISTYKHVVQTFRDTFPKVESPTAVTPDMANRYKIMRLKTCKPESVKGDLNELNTVFGKWWVRICDILEANPFEAIESPKVDKREPRIIETGELEALRTWLGKTWDNWRLPLLFLDVKAGVGCRIRELAAMPTEKLKEGRLTFDAVTAKGRKTRRSKLPTILFEELQRIAGPNYVFEQFPDQLRDLLVRRGRPHQASRVKFPFDPNCLVNWLQDRKVEFLKAHPDIPPFKLHNLRGTAMSKAMEAGANYNDASIAFGCHPETMRRNYLKFDETAISDGVMDRIQAED